MKSQVLKIISFNIDGARITNEHTVDEWENDWYGECDFCPANDDPVTCVELDGDDVPLMEIADKSGDGRLPLCFEHVMAHVGLL